MSAVRRWHAYLAEATGAHHVANGLVHQDACAVAPASGTSDGSKLTVAVADGHGHARHFRSDRGARLAVTIATAIGTRLTELMAGETSAVRVERILRTRFGPGLLTEWRAAIAADLSADPISAAEASSAGLDSPPTDEQLLFGYGATLLVAMVAGPWLMGVQIGDGDFLLIGKDGTVKHPVPQDPRLDGLRTTSLCQPDAVNSFRYAVVPLTGGHAGAVMLATDGYGNAQVRNDWETAFAADLAALVVGNGTEQVGRQLPTWVRRCASAEGSGDDVTVALVFAADATWRVPAAVPTTVNPAEATVVNQPAETVPDIFARPGATPPSRPIPADATTVPLGAAPTRRLEPQRPSSTRRWQRAGDRPAGSVPPDPGAGTASDGEPTRRLGSVTSTASTPPARTRRLTLIASVSLIVLAVLAVVIVVGISHRGGPAPRPVPAPSTSTPTRTSRSQPASVEPGTTRTSGPGPVTSRQPTLSQTN